MDSDIRDLDNERSELREDEKKLQIALQEYDEDWDFASEDEDEDEEGRFLIDLDRESETAGNAQSVNSGASSIGSASHSQQKSNVVEEARNGTDEQQRLLSKLPSSSVAADDPSAESTIGAADPEKALALNRALQGIIEGHIESIQDALERNKERQENLENDGTSSKKTFKLRTGKFRAPYFRIGSECPEPNEDEVAKRQFAQMQTINAQGFSKDLRFFHTKCKPTLRKWVLQDCIEQMIRPLMTKMEAEVERLDHAKSQVEEKECELELERPKLEATKNSKAKIQLKLRLADLEESIKEQKAKVREHTKKISELEEDIAEKKNNTNEKDLLKTVDSEKVDWMRISKMNYDGNKSWLDCQKAWDHFVNPNISTGTWTQKEKTRLKELVEAEGSDSPAQADWVKVAEELGTGRTAFQCLSVYQRNFNPDFRARPWSVEEDQRLIEEANKVYEAVGFFHWRKVSALVDNRNPYECMARFAQVDPNAKRGKFTPEEDAKLLAAVEMYGLRWKEIARFVGTRNQTQVRDRYLVCLNPENNYLTFTYDEDLKLLTQFKEHGPVWSQFTELFPGRSASRLGTRFRQLQRWKKKKEWFDAQPAGVKRVLLGKSLSMNDRKNLETKIRDYFVQQLGINLEDYKRQTLDMRNGVDPEVIPPRPPFIMHLSTVKTCLENHSAKRWVKKISQHKTLQESIERILREEAERREKSNQKEKLPAVVEEEHDEELMNRAVSESLEAQKKNQAVQPKKVKLKKMERLLARAFHQGSSVHVSKILKVLNDPKMEEKESRLLSKHRSLDANLKRFFRHEVRNAFKPGRGRKFFGKDMRLQEVVETEKADRDRLVVPLCVKSLGSNLLQLYVTGRRHHALLQEKVLNFPEGKDDPEYLTQEACINQKLDEIIREEAEDGNDRPDQRNRLDRKKKALLRVFTEKYAMEKKKLQTSALSMQEDLACFQRHLEQSGEISKLPANTLAAWLGSDEKGNQQELSGMDLTGEQCTSEEPVRRNGPDKLNSKARKDQGEEAEAESEQIIETTARDPSALLESKSLHLFTPRELQDEQRCVELLAPLVTSGGSVDTLRSLPCLPPNMTTLMALKSLLLKRGELLRKSAPLRDLSKSNRIEAPLLAEGDLTEPTEQASVKVNNSQENIVLVDSEGQEIKMEDYADFIEEETRDENSKAPASGSLIVPEVMSKWDGRIKSSEKTRKAGTNVAWENVAEGRTKARNLLTSNPEYSLANFAPLPEATKDTSQATILRSTRSHGKVPSGYELVLFPVAKCNPSNVSTKERRKEEFLPPLPVQRKGKTYAHVSRKRDPKALMKAEKSVSAQASVPSGRSNEPFEFPNLTHTQNEIIKINDESSESENDGEGENDSDADKVDDETRRVESSVEPGTKSVKEIPLVLACAKKYENLVEKLQQQREFGCQKRLGEKNVVVVDVAEYAGTDNIVHFVKEKAGEGFKAFESKVTNNVERAEPKGTLEVIQYGQTLSVYNQETIGSVESLRKERMLMTKTLAMPSVRESPEYQMLRLRMQALFLWPVLMSTMKPILNPVLTQTIQETEPDPQPSDGPRRGRPPKAKLRGRPKKFETKAERRERTWRKEAYRRNQFMKQKREEFKKAKVAARAAMASTSTANGGDAGGSSGAMGVMAGVVHSEPVRLEDVTLAFPLPASAEPSKGGANQEPQKIERRGRGKKHKKVYPPPKERPKRQVPKRKAPEEVAPPRETRKRKAKLELPKGKRSKEPKDDIRPVPQWWKDAVLAAMMAKQQAAGREGPDEVPIEEDEDFVDKGDYSDDEWAQEWQNKAKTSNETEPESEVASNSKDR